MQWYHFALIALAISSAVLAWNVPRAALWLSLGAASYVTSAMWHNHGLPYATFYGAVTNFAILAGMWIYADQRWEIRVWNCFHLMVLIDILYMAGFIKDRILFAEALELVNLAAILFVGTTGIVQRVDGIFLGPYRSRWIDFFHRRLWPARSMASRPWWQRKKT